MLSYLDMQNTKIKVHKKSDFLEVAFS